MIQQYWQVIPYDFNALNKMTLTDALKILGDKIKANQAQYGLSREAAKISALLSKIFRKDLNI